MPSNQSNCSLLFSQSVESAFPFCNTNINVGKMDDASGPGKLKYTEKRRSTTRIGSNGSYTPENIAGSSHSAWKPSLYITVVDDTLF